MKLFHITGFIKSVIYGTVPDYFEILWEANLAHSWSQRIIFAPIFSHVGLDPMLFAYTRSVTGTSERVVCRNVTSIGDGPVSP